MAEVDSSGKSYFVFQRAVFKSLLEPNRKTLVLRKTAVNCRRSCFEDMKRTLSQFKITKYCKINQTTMEITLPNNSKFLFMGLDNFEDIKSIPDIHDIIIEECSEITYDDFSELKGRTRGRGKLKNQIVMMMNPVSKLNWTYKHFFQDGCNEEDCLILHSTYKDNPFSNPETIKAYENFKEQNPLFYKIYCLGEFGSLSKNIFQNWTVEDFNIKNVKGEYCYGMDFGYNDPTTISFSKIDEKNKTIYVYDELYRSEMTDDDIYEFICSKGLKNSIIIADSEATITIQTLKKKGVRRIMPCKKGAGSVVAGIRQLQAYRIVVHPNCVNMIKELENYAWKKDKKTSEYMEVPEQNGYDHLIDALRYSLQTLDKKNKVTSSFSIGSIGL